MAITAQKGDNKALRTFKNIKIFSNRHILRIFSLFRTLCLRINTYHFSGFQHLNSQFRI